MVSSVFHHQQRSSQSLILPSAAKKMPSYSTTVSPTHRRGDGSFVDSVCYTAYTSKRPRPLMISQNVDYTSQLQVETSVEYDLPAHIYPPKNAEPILMVDQDYMNRRKKKSRQSTGSSLNFLAVGSAPGIGTSPTTSNIIYNNGSSAPDRLRHSNSNNNTPSRSRKSTPSGAICDCGSCRSSVASDVYTKSGSYSTQASMSSKGISTVTLTASPVLPPAYQARPTPRSTKKSKATAQQQQIQQQIQQLQLQQQQQQPPPAYQQQPLVYPVPPPSYATATNAYGSYHHHKSLCSSICPSSLCAGCTTPMVGAGPPELVPHGFSTAHVVRSRGSPKLRSRRHLTASTASNLPEYHRRPRSNTISHTSTSAPQHHNSLPASFLSTDVTQSTTSQSRLQEAVMPPGLMLNQSELQLHTEQPSRVGKTKMRVVPLPQSYDFDIIEARIADTAQMYSAPITPAELMDEDLFGRGVTDMDTSSGYASFHTNSAKNNNNPNNKNNTSNVFSLGAETSVASRIYAHEKAMEAKTNSNYSSNINNISSSRSLRKSNNISARNTSASVNNITSSSNVNSSSNTSNISISVSSHQYQQQHQQQQQRSHQQQNQFLSQLFRQQEYLKTSSPSTQPSSTLSTPSRLSGLGGHHDLSSMSQDSNSLGTSTNFGACTSASFSSSATPINYRDFLLDNVLMASSPQPSATALFSSPLASHIASQMLGVPTPPQSNSLPTVPVPSVSANRFLATMYHLNPVPAFNLVAY